MIIASYPCARGETFDQISRIIYGSDAYVPDLLMANPKYSGVVVMNGGEVLNVPQVIENSDSATVTAPWKEAAE